jgi:uncharacterized protein YbaR (Trm112 family)
MTEQPGDRHEDRQSGEGLAADRLAASALPENTYSREPAYDRRMLEALVCPVTQTTLAYDVETGELISRAARLAFPVRAGIPIMLISEARDLG